jgi:hypothetical protein
MKSCQNSGSLEYLDSMHYNLHTQSILTVLYLCNLQYFIFTG